MNQELFKICCERPPQRDDQAIRILKLLKQGADVGATDKNGVTALHHAVRFRSPAAVQVLLDNGADVNQACIRNGSTPLHRAVTQTGAPGTSGAGDAVKKIIQILIQAGGDPRIRNHKGKRPLDYVSDDGIRSLLRPK